MEANSHVLFGRGLSNSCIYSHIGGISLRQVPLFRKLDKCKSQTFRESINRKRQREREREKEREREREAETMKRRRNRSWARRGGGGGRGIF